MLYKTHLINKNDESDHKYKNYRNTLQWILRNTKQTFYQFECFKFKNTKKLWQIINEVIRKTSDKSSVVDKISVNNIDYYKGENISNEFAKYFSSVGKNLALKIPDSNKTVQWYLNKIPQNPKSVFLTPCTKQEIKKIINNLPNKTSSGFDGLSNVLLKTLCDSIIDPLNIIYNNSISTGEFPQMMKHAEVIPLFKSGLKNFTNNYRPISLLLTLSKI